MALIKSCLGSNSEVEVITKLWDHASTQSGLTVGHYYLIYLGGASNPSITGGNIISHSKDSNNNGPVIFKATATSITISGQSDIMDAGFEFVGDLTT